MWTTKGVPIGPFLDKFVHLARAENYKYLMLLVARPADEYAVYENLYNDWRSIHEVTGPDIMFLFVGSDAGNCNEMAGFIEDVNHESPLHFSPHIAVTGGGGHVNARKEKGLRNGYGLASLTEHVRSLQEFSLLAESHESQIRDLRKRFSLLEAELPATSKIGLSGCCPRTCLGTAVATERFDKFTNLSISYKSESQARNPRSVRAHTFLDQGGGLCS